MNESRAIDALEAPTGRAGLEEASVSGSGCRGRVADVPQRVEAAAGELAGHRDPSDVSIEALTELAVVGVVR